MKLNRRQICEIYGPAAKEVGLRHNLEPSLILAVIEQESMGDDRAASGADAYGLMQLRHTAVSDYNRKTNSDFTMYDALFLRRTNIEIGSWYLRWLLAELGDPREALRAYNVGIGTVRKGDPLPGSEYADSVLERKRGIEAILSI
jgi:soluble lytic murein transglycosylase